MLPLRLNTPQGPPRHLSPGESAIKTKGVETAQRAKTLAAQAWNPHKDGRKEAVSQKKKKKSLEFTLIVVGYLSVYTVDSQPIAVVSWFEREWLL